MAPKRCCIYKCPSRRNDLDNISLHGFPQGLEMREKWLDAVRGYMGRLTTGSHVCAIHFTVDSFGDKPGKHARLKKKALPTLFGKKINFGAIWWCRLCKRSFDAVHSRDEHEKAAHADELEKAALEVSEKDSPQWKCRRCSKIFDTLQARVSHEKSTHLEKLEAPAPAPKVAPAPAPKVASPLWWCRHCRKMFYHQQARNKHEETAHADRWLEAKDAEDSDSDELAEETVLQPKGSEKKCPGIPRSSRIARNADDSEEDTVVEPKESEKNYALRPRRVMTARKDVNATGGNKVSRLKVPGKKCPRCRTVFANMFRLCRHIELLHELPMTWKHIHCANKTVFNHFLSEEERRSRSKFIVRKNVSWCAWTPTVRDSKEERARDTKEKKKKRERRVTCPAHFKVVSETDTEIVVKYQSSHYHYDYAMENLPAKPKMKVFKLVTCKENLPDQDFLSSDEDDLYWNDPDYPAWCESDADLRSFAANFASCELAGVEEGKNRESSKLIDIVKNHNVITDKVASVAYRPDCLQSITELQRSILELLHVEEPDPVDDADNYHHFMGLEDTLVDDANGFFGDTEGFLADFNEPREDNKDILGDNNEFHENNEKYFGDSQLPEPKAPDEIAVDHSYVTKKETKKTRVKTEKPYWYNNWYKLLNAEPPPLDPSNSTLPRRVRQILAQLRRDSSPFLFSYLHKRKPDLNPSPNCPLCEKIEPTVHDTSHLFECPVLPTTLTPRHLWTDPVAATEFLKEWSACLGRKFPPRLKAKKKNPDPDFKDWFSSSSDDE